MDCQGGKEPKVLKRCYCCCTDLNVQILQGSTDSGTMNRTKAPSFAAFGKGVRKVCREMSTVRSAKDRATRVAPTISP